MPAPTVRPWLVALITLITTIVAAVVTWTAVTSPMNELRSTIEFEQLRTGELKARIASMSAEASAAAAAAEMAEAAATPAVAPPVRTVTAVRPGAKKTFTSYAYIKKMTGPLGETFTVYLDTFRILTGATAKSYAKSHHVTLPSNGILYVNEDHDLTSYPLADTARITAYTGGVEQMAPLPLQAGKLQQWVSDPTIIPDASSDMWQVVVTKGTVSSIKMIAVAD